MKKIIFKSQAIQSVILIVTALLLISLWPLRIWQEEVVSSVEPATGNMSEVITEDKMLMQTIIASYDHMNTMRVYLGENCVGESFVLRILDSKWQQVCEQETVIDQGNLPGFHEVLVDVDMEVGTMYYLILQGKNSEIFVGCESVPLFELPHLGTMYYCDSTQEGMSLVADYCYGMPLRKEKVLPIAGILLLLSALSVLAVKFYYRNKEDRLVTVEKTMQVCLNPLIAAGTVFALVAVLLGYCSKHLLDNTVYFISILLLAGILFYAVNHNRDGVAPILTWEYIKSHIGDFVQSVAIAGAVWACCEYLSGLYDIHHAVAVRKELLWFSLAVIAMFRWKEIINWYNALYLIVSGICGYSYYKSNLTPEMDEAGVQVLKYTVCIAVLLGFVLIRTLIGFAKKKMSRPAYLYAGLLVVFFAMMIIFRNGRWWPVTMAVAFLLFYLNYGMWEHKDRLLTNIVRGVVLQFILSTGYCLLHRPYVSYRNARYTHIFHTVTITATYLTMVECVAAVLLFVKFAKSRKLKDCWKELLLFGVVSSYMIFTMARTAYLAIGVTGLFILVVLTCGKGREKLLNMGRNLALMILAVVICLPVTFVTQRTVPALVSEPFLYEIEYSLYCPEDVMRGRQLNSHNFMRVGRFIDVFSEKIFGLPEGTFDVYGEIEAYRKEHGAGEEGADDNTLKNNPSGLKSFDAEKKEEKKEKIPGVADASQLVASADFVPGEAPEEPDDYTNGRLDIFKTYLSQLNMTGHDTMWVTLANDAMVPHAHNIYLQVAHDHGAIVGILFIMVGVVTFIKALIYYRKKKEIITYAALPVIITVAVAVAGVAEWIFHISNTCGFLLLLVITPLLFKNEG